jgi:hypothetical protein
LEKRIKEARDQLDKRLPRGKLFFRAFGIIALDVTKVAFAHNGLTMGLTADHSRDVLRSKIELIAHKVECFPGVFGNANLLAVMLQIHIPSLVVNSPQTLTRFSSGAVDNPNLGLLQSLALFRFTSLFPVGMDPAATDSPPSERRLRERVEFETGTLLWWEPELVDEFLNSGTVPEFNDEREVLRIVKAGKSLTFVFGELTLALAQLDESDVARLRSERTTFMAEMMARLYMQRFRYEDE